MSWQLVVKIFAILLITVSLSFCENTVDYPVGVSLGQYHLSSAYYNAKNELIDVVTIDSSQEWREYYWATWTDPKSHTPDYDPETMAMFTRTLQSIQNATEATLGHSITYRSVTAPEHFTLRSSMSTLMRAAYEEHFFAIDQSYQVVSLHNAARLAYDLDNCKGYGFPIGCDVDEIDSFVLVVEYTKKYLAVSFLNIGQYLAIPINGRKFPRHGEEENENHKNKGDVMMELGLSIRQFMNEMIAYLLEANIEDPETKVQGIILIGEASTRGMDDMRQVIGATLSEYKHDFLLSMNPGTLGAVGAAHRARQYVTEHAILGPRKGSRHEEL